LGHYVGAALTPVHRGAEAGHGLGDRAAGHEPVGCGPKIKLFHWRKPIQEGALSVVRTDEEVIPVSEVKVTAAPASGVSSGFWTRLTCTLLFCPVFGDGYNEKERMRLIPHKSPV